jgi:Rod binding domain-containing protein
MDIHLLPGAVAAAAGASPAQVQQSRPPEESFHQALQQAAAKPDEISKAATQFESLIIGQVLKAARQSSDKGWLGTGDDQTGDMAMEMAEQGLAQGLAAQGGFGIAKMVSAKLRREAATPASSGPAARNPPTPPNKDSARPASALGH